MPTQQEQRNYANYASLERGINAECQELEFIDCQTAPDLINYRVAVIL